MVIPKWLNKYLTSDEILKLEQEIADVELLTQAEIMPVIVSSSSSYSYLKVNLMLFTAFIFTLLADILIPHLYWDHGVKSLISLSIGFLIVFFLAPWLAKNRCIKSFFVFGSEKSEQVFKRARIEFYENRITNTKEKIGVLIFISMIEHQVVILADKKISDALPEDTWQKSVNIIIKNMKSKKMFEGLSLGLKELSLPLIKHFPVKPNDKNELSNQVIIKD